MHQHNKLADSRPQGRARSRDAEDDRTAARHAEIARRYARREAWKAELAPARINRVAAKRIRNLELYLEHRYGKTLPEGDDAAREDLIILLNHLAQNPMDTGGKIHRSIRLWAPWMPAAEANGITRMILERPRRYRATTLGKLLGYTKDEQALLRTETIRPVGVTDADLKERKRARDREAKAEKRAAEPAKRARGRPKTGAAEPWVAIGWKKAKYYRKKKAGELPDETKNVSPHKSALMETTHFKSHGDRAVSIAGRLKRPCARPTPSSSTWR